MQKLENNYAYIDGANLHNGIQHLDWPFEYKRFRIWLREKYSIRRTFVFIGYIPKYQSMYDDLRSKGFELIFKQVVYNTDGHAKGNCDADLIVHAMRDVYEKQVDNILLVSSDGDFTPLVQFLMERKKLLAIVSPNKSRRCSILLKRTNARITYLSDHRRNLAHLE